MISATRHSKNYQLTGVQIDSDLCYSSFKELPVDWCSDWQWSLLLVILRSTSWLVFRLAVISATRHSKKYQLTGVQIGSDLCYSSFKELPVDWCSDWQWSLLLVILRSTSWLVFRLAVISATRHSKKYQLTGVQIGSDLCYSSFKELPVDWCSDWQWSLLLVILRSTSRLVFRLAVISATHHSKSYTGENFPPCFS